MDEYRLVITRAKKLEAMLKQGFNAQGEGLSELAKSVRGSLPEHVFKRLKFIARTRNDLIHNEQRESLRDREAFERACDDAERELTSLSPALQPPRAQKNISHWVVIAVVVSLFIIWQLYQAYPTVCIIVGVVIFFLYLVANEK